MLLELLKNTDVKYSLKKTEIPEVEWAIELGMGAYVYFFLEKQSIKKLPVDLYTKLKASYYSSVFSAKDQSDAMVAMLVSASESDCEVCLLKGISVSQQYYPQAHLRLMRDIDLLLRPGDIPTFESILVRQAYQQISKRPDSYYQAHHHSMPFYHSKRKVWVEVHAQLFREGSWRSTIPAFSAENVRREMCSSSFEGLPVLRLSAELQLVYIASHWAEDFKPVGGLFALWDGVLLLRNEAQFDWGKLLTWTKESELLALPVYFLLDNMRRHQLFEINQRYMRSLRSHCGVLSHSRLFVCNKIIDKFYLQPGQFGKLLSPFTLNVMWDEAFKPGAPFLLRLLWRIIFPLGHKDRYCLSWHWRRIKKILTFN